MAGFLLLPEDELTLVAHLLEDESLTRLAHEDLSYGPQIAGALREPLALPDAEPARLTFWASTVGELHPGADAFVDHGRSPIVVWHRARWHASGALVPGRLSSQTRRRAEQPPALPALYDRVQRWMKREAVTLKAYDAPELPSGERPPVVRAFPHAARWAAEGGPVWPWPQ